MRHVLRQLAGRVWWYPHDEDPDNIQGGVAVIADPAGSIVVDAGNSPSTARGIQAAIGAAGLAAARRLIYTHHHWDHVWGACAWPEVEIIGHRTGARVLEVEARRPWSHPYLRAEVEANPKLGPSFRGRAWAMPSWEGFAVVPPHTEFGDGLNLPGGVEVRHVGGRHAEDSTVVAVPDSGVVLLGDCFYPPPHHLRQAGDGYDIDLVDRLLEEYPVGRFDWFVDSHSRPRSRQSLLDLILSDRTRRR